LGGFGFVGWGGGGGGRQPKALDALARTRQTGNPREGKWIGDAPTDKNFFGIVERKKHLRAHKIEKTTTTEENNYLVYEGRSQKNYKT